MTKLDYEALSEFELVELLKRGDQKAFSEIFVRYDKQLYRHALYYLKDPEAARDVVQDVFTKLWLMKDGLTIAVSPGSYLMTMTRNHVLNWIRTRSRLLARNYTLVQTGAEDDLEDKIFSGMDDELASRNLRKAIDLLPPQQKMVVELKNSGYSNADIVEMTGLSLNTIKTHYSQALKKLRSTVQSGTIALMLLVLGL